MDAKPSEEHYRLQDERRARERAEKREAGKRSEKRRERRERVGAVAIYIGVMMGMMLPIAGVRWAWMAYQCDAACDLREQPHEYLFGQGCYCQDEAGWYNPNDER